MHVFIYVFIIFCIICKTYQAKNEVVIKASKSKIEELGQFLKDHAYAFNDRIHYVRDVVSSEDIDEYISYLVEEYASNPTMVRQIKGIKLRKEGGGETFASVIEHHGKVSVMVLASIKRNSEFEIILASVDSDFELNSRGFWRWLTRDDDNAQLLAKKFNNEVVRGFLLTQVASKAGLGIEYETGGGKKEL